MTKTYHVNFATRILERPLTTTLLRSGVKIGTMSLLTVRGRKSGQPHTVPVTLVEQDGARWQGLRQLTTLPIKIGSTDVAYVQ
jgi:hypothetical protein